MTVLTRPLSDLEHLLRCRTASGLYRSFQLTATYSQELTIPIIYASLRKTLLQYPSLICNVIKDSHQGDCFFHPIESATLNDVLEILPQREYLSGNKVSESFMKYANTTEFALYQGKPLFKLFLVGKFNLSIVLEHTIADGLVGPYFHEILLDNLLTLIKNGHIDGSVNLNTELFNFTKDKSEMNSLPPPIDWFMAPYTEPCHPEPCHPEPCHPEPCHPEPGQTSPEEEELPLTTNLWPGRIPTAYDVPIAFKLINFSPQEVQLILTKCKQENVTITTYIEVIQLLTLAPIFGNQHHTSHKIALSLRRFIDPNHDITKFDDKNSSIYNQQLNDPTYKYMASAAHVGLSMNLPQVNQFSWDLVRSISQKLKKQVDNNRLLNTLSGFFDTYDKVGDNISFFTDNMANPDKVDTSKLSNLGVFKFPTFDNWTITDMIFAQDVMPYSAEFMLNVISTPTSGMNLLWSYFESDQVESIDPYIPKFRENIWKYIH